MTLTLLFDLDDTLLDNPIETFLPEYTRGLADRLQSSIDPRVMVPQLMAATKAMVQNLQPGLSLNEVFDEAFYPALQIQRQAVQPDLDKFYAEDFPALQRLTRRFPEAIQSVDDALQRGYRVAVATNPLFPKTAVLQRLVWAGLPADEYPWQSIPCFEDFHFAKPHAEFFAELLGQIGWPDGPVIVVGNDFENDIRPAQQLGLASFWVKDNPLSQAEPDSPRHMSGRLSELMNWLDHTPREALNPDISSRQALLASLRATPSALLSLTHNLPEASWKARPFPREWTLTEIACHLRDVESEVNLPRIDTVLVKENPFISGKNTDAWADERNYAQQDGRQALLDFVHQRVKLTEILASASETQWSLPARHAIFGPVQMQELVSIAASHDRLHLQTIKQLVNKLI